MKRYLIYCCEIMKFLCQGLRFYDPFLHIIIPSLYMKIIANEVSETVWKRLRKNKEKDLSPSI